MKKLFIILFVLLLSSKAYSNDLAEDFKYMIDNLDSNAIESYKKSDNIDGIKEISNVKLYRLNNSVCEDIRGLDTENDFYAIAVNRKKATLTVYKYDSVSCQYNIPVVSFAISVNYKRTPLGIFYMEEKHRWKEMFGECYSQYASRITGHFLFHSVIYRQNENKNSLIAHTYNGLQTGEQSKGCVRLRVCDAKYIYEKIDSGSLIYIYDSDYVGPFSRPSFDLIPSDTLMDPTDIE